MGSQVPTASIDFPQLFETIRDACMHECMHACVRASQDGPRQFDLRCEEELRFEVEAGSKVTLTVCARSSRAASCARAFDIAVLHFSFRMERPRFSGRN